MQLSGRAGERDPSDLAGEPWDRQQMHSEEESADQCRDPEWAPGKGLSTESAEINLAS